MAPVEPMIPAEIAPERASLSRRTSQTESMLRMQRSSHSSAGGSLKEGGSLRAKLGLAGVARRTLGISLLMVTVCLWTLSNFLASVSYDIQRPRGNPSFGVWKKKSANIACRGWQYIFSDNTYSKPFFVVYANTSIFAISLIPMAIKFLLKNGVEGFRNAARDVWYEHKYGIKAGKSQQQEDDDDATAGERLLVDDEGALDPADAAAAAEKEERLTFRETAVLSLEFCMLWFLANYFASACLEYTSVGSVTILTSTSSVWTLIFCALMRVEGFTYRKLVGVLASLAGVVLISSVDLSGASDENRGNFPHKTQAQIAIGDAMAFVSSIIYGLYVTVMKRRVGNEDRVNMPLFFGLVGVLNLVLLWPGFFILHFTGIETFELPPTSNVWFIIILNSISSFISDMSWAYAMLLTTPLVVTVGLSLTIPLSLIGEMIQYAQYSSWVYWVGATVVFVSFVFVNNESHEEGGSSGPPQRASDGGHGSV